MKLQLSLLYSLNICFCLLFVSTACNKLQTIYEEVGGNTFIIRQKHKKDTQWLFGVMQGKQGYSIIPTIYDNIEFCFAFYIAQKDRKKYIFNLEGRDVIAPDQLIEYKVLGYNLYYRECFCKEFCWKIRGKKGIYFYSTWYPQHTFGPYEDIQPGSGGFMYKEKGKWGYQNYLILSNKEVAYKENVAAHYNAIIELTEYGVSRIRLLVKEGKQWKALGPDGSFLRNVSNKEISHIKKVGKEYKSLNISRIIEYNNNHKTPEQERIGTEEAARICIKRAYSINKSVFDPPNTIHDNPVPFENPY